MEKKKIPELLKTAEGSPIGSREEWECRRQHLKELLCREEYGFLPPPPESVIVTLAERRENFCAGKAVYERLLLRVRAGTGEHTFPVYGVIPTGVEKPMTFLLCNFRPEVPDVYLPTEEIVDNGFAVFSFCYEDVTRDNGDFSDGLAGLYPQLQSRGPEDPGKIALWAWAMQRVMDHLQQRKDIDPRRVAAVGHSRLGKTALLAAAMDGRFALAVSNDSGCSGAALTRDKRGERVKEITGSFPFWFCENYRAYAGREEEMLFDQHFLLALMAPGRLYVCSAEEDLWADPAAELAACRLASPVYGLYGEQGLVCPEEPELGKGYHEGCIGYHVRPGTHYLSRFDWQRFMEYLKRHG